MIGDKELNSHHNNYIGMKIEDLDILNKTVSNIKNVYEENVKHMVSHFPKMKELREKCLIDSKTELSFLGYILEVDMKSLANMEDREVKWDLSVLDELDELGFPKRRSGLPVRPVQTKNGLRIWLEECAIKLEELKKDSEEWEKALLRDAHVANAITRQRQVIDSLRHEIRGEITGKQHGII